MDMIESRGNKALQAAGTCMMALALALGLSLFATSPAAAPLTQDEQRLLSAIDTYGKAVLANGFDVASLDAKAKEALKAAACVPARR